MPFEVDTGCAIATAGLLRESGGRGLPLMPIARLASRKGSCPAVVNDGIVLFLSVLPLILVMMLWAGFRASPPARSLPQGDQAAGRPAPAWTAGASERAPLRNARPAPAPSSLARSGSHFGKAKYEARHVTERKPGRSSPPWGPAPRPPDLRG